MTSVLRAVVRRVLRRPRPDGERPGPATRLAIKLASVVFPVNASGNSMSVR